MHITTWEASRSGAGITVAMTDAGGVRHKQYVKKIISQAGAVTAIGGDGARFPLKTSFVDKLSDAEIAVLHERQRQFDGEEFSAERDDHYTGLELARAAAAYAIANVHPAGRLWPWTSEWWKPGDHRRNCVKAAALLIAEIERLDRMQLKAAKAA